jgi:(p)ppGpp synthase/HD superfamily hydrolase
MICAAILHDVLEDTPVTYAELLHEFGHHTALLVQELTNVSKLTDRNRAQRKAMDREQLAKSSVAAATIKLADCISNTPSIVAEDPKFGDPGLYAQIKRQIEAYKQSQV